MPSRLIISEGKTLPTPSSGKKWATSYKANVEGDRMNPGIRILPLPSANDLPGGRMSGQRSGLLFVLKIGNSLRWMNHKLANDMNMWKGNGNAITLFFSLKKKLEILHQERSGKENAIVMKQFNSILFHKCRSANRSMPINQSINIVDVVINLQLHS